MVSFISKDSLFKILSKFDIIRVLSSFIELKKKHNGYFSHCPFHKERTPSFFVSPEKQKYYCFGCHRSGNIISFLMEYKNISFINAINFLLKKEKNEICAQAATTTTTTHLMKTVSFLYKQNLETQLKSNNTIIQFLNKRGLNNKLIERFQLGFASNSWCFLSKSIKEFEKNKNQLISLGLLIKKNYVYDRFRNRLIFPIRNLDGNILGFGGRVLDDYLKPKYINSPESKIFSKKKELYGLYETLLDKKTNSYIIIVEGYLDVIALHKHDVTNVVAVLGTSFNKNHLHLLKSSYNKIIFCFDGDTAGQNASIRTAYTCLPYIDLNIFIGFVLLPKKHDPDSYINAFGKNKFLSILEKATYILDYIYNIISLNLNSNILHNKIILANKLYKIIKKINNPLSKKIILDYFLKRLTKRMEDTISKSFTNRQPYNTKKTFSLGMKCCAFIMKSRELVKLIDTAKLTLNKNIKFKSDLNTFLELVIILRQDINIKFHFLKKKCLEN